MRDEVLLIALAYLVKSEKEGRPARAVARLRNLAAGAGLARLEATELLVEVFEDRDIDLLLERNVSSSDPATMAVIAKIVARASLTRLRALSTGDNPGAAVAAIEELRRRKRPLTSTQVKELLYSEQPRIRYAALKEALQEATVGDAESLLSRYTSERESFYYNVVCGIDEFIAERRDDASFPAIGEIDL